MKLKPTTKKRVGGNALLSSCSSRAPTHCGTRDNAPARPADGARCGSRPSCRRGSLFMGNLPVYATSMTAGKRESTSHVSRLAPRRLHLDLVYDRGLAEFEDLIGRAGREKMHSPGDDAGPAGLVTGTEAGAVV